MTNVRTYIMDGATITPFKKAVPKLGEGVFVASGARLIGDLILGDDVSIWFNAVVRADVHFIRIGARTNIQDNATVHVTENVHPCVIGADVTVGHNALVHACTVEDLCLIGMGAVVLDGALIRKGSLVAAGAVVPPGRNYPPNSLILGSPAKAVRTLTESELNGLADSAARYILSARAYQSP
jgi:carbonic anhydrase/acetyltransferase-like protein (isoleucine patch superfamily)